MTDQSLALKDAKLQAFFKEKYVLTEDAVNNVMSLPILKLVYPEQGVEPTVKDGKIIREIDGQDVPLYSFYHSGTKKAYKDPEVVLMSHVVAKLPSYEDPTVLKHNDLMGGYLLEDQAPFVFFFKGLSLQDWWSFLEKLSAESKGKTIPTFALIAKFSTAKKDSMDGKRKGMVYPVITLTGKVLTDLDTLTVLADNVDKVKEGIKSFIDVKGGTQAAQPVETEQPKILTSGNEEISADDIPLD